MSSNLPDDDDDATRIYRPYGSPPPDPATPEPAAPEPPSAEPAASEPTAPVPPSAASAPFAPPADPFAPRDGAPDPFAPTKGRPDPFAPGQGAVDPFAPAEGTRDPFAPSAGASPAPFDPPAVDPFAPATPAARDPFEPAPAVPPTPAPIPPSAPAPPPVVDPFAAPAAADPFAPAPRSAEPPRSAPPPMSDPFAPVVPPSAPPPPAVDPFAPPAPGAFDGAAPSTSAAPAPDPFRSTAPDPFAPKKSASADPFAPAASGAPDPFTPSPSASPDPFSPAPRAAAAQAHRAAAVALPTGTGRLADAFSGVFALVLHLRASSDFGDAGALRERADALLDQAVGRARAGGHAAADVSEAEFCLVAFIDEAVLMTDWPGRDGWAATPLQLSRYQRYDAGEAFFDRLRDLMNSGAERDQVLEVYYLCIALGYKGRYQIHGREVLGQLVVDLEGRLARAPGGTVRPLSENAVPRGPRASAAAGGIPTWAFFAGAAALVLLLYLALSFSVSGIANGVADDVQALAPSGQTR